MALYSTINLISTQNSPAFFVWHFYVYPNISLQLGHDSTTQYISKAYKTSQSFPILPGSVQFFSSCVPLGDAINLLFLHISDRTRLSAIVDSRPILNRKRLCPLSLVFSCIILTGLYAHTSEEHGQTMNMWMQQNRGVTGAHANIGMLGAPSYKGWN